MQAAEDGAEAPEVVLFDPEEQAMPEAEKPYVKVCPQSSTLACHGASWGCMPEVAVPHWPYVFMFSWGL